MTIDEAIKRYTDNAEYERTHDNLQGCIDFRQLAEWLRELKKYRVKDAISRQTVLDVLKDKWNMFSDANDAMQESIDTIEALTPVTPQQRIGKWIKSRDSYGNNHFTCPFCEHDIATKYAGTWEDNYCSNCGAFLGGDNNGNE